MQRMYEQAVMPKLPIFSCAWWDMFTVVCVVNRYFSCNYLLTQRQKIFGPMREKMFYWEAKYIL
jgi:hypothetical protein